MTNTEMLQRVNELALYLEKAETDLYRDCVANGFREIPGMAGKLASLTLTLRDDIANNLCGAADCHIHVCAADAAFCHGLGSEHDIVSSEKSVHLSKKIFAFVTYFIEGAHDHVTRGTHITFQIKCFHSVRIPPF